MNVTKALWITTSSLAIVLSSSPAFAAALTYTFVFDAPKNPDPAPPGATVGDIRNEDFDKKTPFGSTGFPNGANFKNNSTKNIVGFWIDLSEASIKNGDEIDRTKTTNGGGTLFEKPLFVLDQKSKKAVGLAFVVEKGKDIKPGDFHFQQITKTDPNQPFLGQVFDDRKLLAEHIKARKAVPEPLTILGVTTAAGFGAFFKRKLSSTSKMG